MDVALACDAEPAGHATGLVSEQPLAQHDDVVGQYFPAEQGTQPFDEFDVWPAGHREHCSPPTAPVADVKPTGHLAQEILPRSFRKYVPAEHGTQADCAAFGRPVVHSEQVVWPAVVETVREAHAAQRGVVNWSV